jgi:hypothetical protein
MKRKTFKRHLAVVLAGGILWVAPVRSADQAARDAIATVRSDLKADRKAVIAEEMKLTERESDGFWPIYRSYRADVDKVTDDIVKLILGYADVYPNVPEDKAEEMLKQYTQAEANLLKVKTKYLKQLLKVLPASKVFRFAQLENRFDLQVRMGLAAAIPVMPAAKPRPTAEQH